MTIETRPFGRIEVPEESVIDFPRGLYGLGETRRYCLLPHEGSEGFHWLLSAETPGIAMLVTDPFRFFPGYEVVIPDAEAELLGASAAEEIAIYTPVTVAREERQVTTNLLGPLAIHHGARRGVQLVQDGSRYSTRHPLVGEA